MTTKEKKFTALNVRPSTLKKINAYAKKKELYVYDAVEELVKKATKNK